MLLRVSVPALPRSASVRLRAWHAAPGDMVAAGATLLDLEVDLAAGVDQDCPPVSICRIVLREDAWLQQRLAEIGDGIAAGTMLALLATDREDAPGGAPEREARVTVAVVLDHGDWWNG